MCTIGSVYNKGANISFKQCDLIEKVEFYEPSIERGVGDILYLAFKRKDSQGAWAGINSYGVSFVAADAYMEEPIEVPKNQENVFEAYLHILSSCKTAVEAETYMTKFYDNFHEPDILLINDNQLSVLIENSHNKRISIKRNEGFIASTNHFRLLHGSVLYQNNQSTYLRLNRAEMILQESPSLKGVFDVVSDQYYGNTVMSVCRDSTQTPDGESAYSTQATAIFSSDGEKQACAFQLNGNPRCNNFTVINDIFGKPSKHKNIPYYEVSSVFN